MNVSYHNEYSNLDDFVDKANKFKNSVDLYSFKIEFVVAPENENLLEDVIENLLKQYKQRWKSRELGR